MELAGLEPAPSWVRSSRPLTSKVPRLQRFMGERLECRNISRNSLHRVLQRHEILDRLPAPSKRSAGEHLQEREGVEPLAPQKCQVLRTRRPTGLDAATLTRSRLRRQAMRD